MLRLDQRPICSVIFAVLCLLGSGAVMALEFSAGFELHLKMVPSASLKLLMNSATMEAPLWRSVSLRNSVFCHFTSYLATVGI